VDKEKKEKREREKRKKERAKHIRKIRRDRKNSPEHKLDVFWGKESKGIKDANDLILIVREVNCLSLRKRVLRSFLDRDNITFDNFDRMLAAAGDILKEDSLLSEEFYKECFSVSTQINLSELGDAASIKEIIRRIETGSDRKKDGFQALINIFRETPDLEIRSKLWSIIKEFDPNEKTLIEIYNIVYGKYGFHKIVADIQKSLKRKGKEKARARRIIRRMEKILAQIKERQE
jgi:hypothetical protein